MDVTARLTWDFLNEALIHAKREPIKVWAVGGLEPPVDVAAERARWVEDQKMKSATLA